MRSILTPMLAAAVVFCGGAGPAWSDVSFGVSGDEGGIRQFYLAIGDFYNVPEREVVVVKEKHFQDEELPVVFFLAQRARVSPNIIIDLRLGGKSWMDITYYYGLGAEIFYVPTRTIGGPPYGRAIGYYKKRPRREWRYIKLRDDDVVNLVNLKFISTHYGYSADDVIKMRSEGKNFIDINKQVKEHKSGKKQISAKKKESARNDKDSRKPEASKAKPGKKK